MASTPVILLSKRSGNSSDRPNAATVQAGEIAMSFGAADPGLYFKDSAGSIRKFGSNHYGTTAPNSSPLGSPGNSVGELWTDSSTSNYYLRVWTGAAWQKVGVGFADTANSANTAVTANSAATATVANSAIVASGALSAVIASGSLSAVIASGALSAVVASGSISAVISSGSLSAIVASGIAVVTALPAASTGSLVYLNAGASGLYVSANGGWILT